MLQEERKLLIAIAPNSFVTHGLVDFVSVIIILSLYCIVEYLNDNVLANVANTFNIERVFLNKGMTILPSN